MFLFNSPQLHVGHNIVTVTILLSIYYKIKIIMDFVSNFIYLSKVNGSWWMYYVLFFFTSKEIRIRIEIYVNAYHVYRSCCWRRYNSTNQNTWNKLQISIKILSCTKIKFEFDMGLNVPSFTCIDFFSWDYHHQTFDKCVLVY